MSNSCARTSRAFRRPFTCSEDSQEKTLSTQHDTSEMRAGTSQPHLRPHLPRLSVWDFSAPDGSRAPTDGNPSLSL
eukprot:1189659-Prorocentrum_minimum.AAC.1